MNPCRCANFNSSRFTFFEKNILLTPFSSHFYFISLALGWIRYIYWSARVDIRWQGEAQDVLEAPGAHELGKWGGPRCAQGKVCWGAAGCPMMHRTREPGRWDEVKIALRESSIPPQPQFPVPSFGNRWTSLSLPGWDNICKLADNHNDSDTTRKWWLR